MSKIERGKQRSYSLAEKIKILKCLNEPGITRKDVQQKFDLSESTLRGFIKSKNKLFESFESASVDLAKRKRKRDSTRTPQINLISKPIYQILPVLI